MKKGKVEIYHIQTEWIYFKEGKGCLWPEFNHAFHIQLFPLPWRAKIIF